MNIRNVRRIIMRRMLGALQGRQASFRTSPKRRGLACRAHSRFPGRPGDRPRAPGAADTKRRHRSRRRQPAGGHRDRQEIAVRQAANTKVIRDLEVSRVPGLFQTPEYARVVFDTNPARPATPPWPSGDESDPARTR
ncbi:Scr1 family TA system antitoxin-like transcriptional regulator [Streptomyces sp. NPDC007084]|uniref:Scr1 family TA system antitoxin-like transcriptional regulator n=1 Tax=Streptomyces sp. NPDC007084 TaxID=3154313 RepID=UPI003454B87A